VISVALICNHKCAGLSIFFTLQDDIDTIEAKEIRNCDVLVSGIKRETRYSEKDDQDQNKAPLSNSKNIHKNNTVCMSFSAKSLFV
jgi:hypothetical protein